MMGNKYHTMLVAATQGMTSCSLYKVALNESRPHIDHMISIRVGLYEHIFSSRAGLHCPQCRPARKQKYGQIVQVGMELVRATQD